MPEISIVVLGSGAVGKSANMSPTLRDAKQLLRLSTIYVAGLIAMLLIMAGIERNPGPPKSLKVLFRTNRPKDSPQKKNFFVFFEKIIEKNKKKILFLSGEEFLFSIGDTNCLPRRNKNTLTLKKSVLFSLKKKSFYFFL